MVSRARRSIWGASEAVIATPCPRTPILSGSYRPCRAAFHQLVAIHKMFWARAGRGCRGWGRTYPPLYRTQLPSPTRKRSALAWPARREVPQAGHASPRKGRLDRQCSSPSLSTGLSIRGPSGIATHCIGSRSIRLRSRPKGMSDSDMAESGWRSVLRSAAGDKSRSTPTPSRRIIECESDERHQ